MTRPWTTVVLLAALCCWPADSARAARIAQDRAAAQDPPTAPRAQDRADLREAIAFAKERVYPALVNIEVVSRRFSGGRTVRSVRSGSGTIIDPEGHVVTNYHVTRDALRITCTLTSGEQLPAGVVGQDAPTDVSVLKLHGLDRSDRAEPLPYAGLGDSDKVDVGKLVIAVGNPLSLSSSMTLGIVSNTRRVFLSGRGNQLQELDLGSGNRTGSFTLWIQHDALILPGSSGGPLVNLAGEIVGVNTRGRDGYGFASPSNLVKDVVRQLLDRGEVRRGWIGASLLPVAKLGRDDGALVSSVVQGSPADDAGLEPGDILLELGGKHVVARFFEEIPPLYGEIAALEPGEVLEAAFLRDGEARMTTVEVAPMQQYVGREAEIRKLGVTVQDITLPMARARGLPDTSGILVTGIRAGLPFEEAEPRITRGDVILSVAGEKVGDIDGFQRSVAHAERSDVAIEYRRDDEILLTVVDVEEDEPRRRGGELAKAWLGVRTQVLTPKVAAALGLEERKGFRVSEVYARTKAEEAGLRVGDVIVALDEEPLGAWRPQDARDLENRIENRAIGEGIELAILRDGEELTIPVGLEESPASAQDAKKARNDVFELAVRNLTRMDRIRDDLPYDLRGVLVTEATAGGVAHLAGISAGQIVLRVAGEPTADVDAFEKVLSGVIAAKPDSVPVFLRKGHSTTFAFVEFDWSGGEREVRRRDG